MESEAQSGHWHASETGRARLEHDEAVVREHQPQMRYEHQADGALWLVGDFLLYTQSGIPHQIPTVIEFAYDYPRHEPIARDVAGRFQHDADHHFIGDHACLWLKQLESEWRRDDRDALQLFLDQLTIFYFRQLVMESDPSGQYPGRARPHGYAPAYVEILSERLQLPQAAVRRMRSALAGDLRRSARCPCGSRLPYRACHRDAISQFRGQVSQEQLAKFLAYLASPDANAA
jgi:hypothetical protein